MSWIGNDSHVAMVAIGQAIMISHDHAHNNNDHSKLGVFLLEHHVFISGWVGPEQLVCMALYCACEVLCVVLLYDNIHCALMYVGEIVGGGGGGGWS